MRRTKRREVDVVDTTLMTVARTGWTSTRIHTSRVRTA